MRGPSWFVRPFSNTVAAAVGSIGGCPRNRKRSRMTGRAAGSSAITAVSPAISGPSQAGGRPTNHDAPRTAATATSSRTCCLVSPPRSPPAANERSARQALVRVQERRTRARRPRRDPQQLRVRSVALWWELAEARSRRPGRRSGRRSPAATVDDGGAPRQSSRSSARGLGSAERRAASRRAATSS